MTIQELLTEAKKKMKTQREVAKTLGVTDAYLSELITGKRSGKARLFEFAEKLGVDVLGKIPVRAREIPVIAWAHAGDFVERVDAWPPGVSGVEEPVYTTLETGPNAFGLMVIGASMEPTIMEGDIAIVDPAVICGNGSICLVCVDGEVSIKRFFDSGTEIRLVPDNKKVTITVIPKDSLVDFQVIGKVVASERRFA